MLFCCVYSQSGYNTNLACSSMSPVDALSPNTRGFHDVFGNAWQWTPDYFSALDGFTVHPYYEDFSTPCFDGQHNVIVGGSFISSGNEASVHSRFHFRPHFFQHASFRLVEQLDTSSPSDIPTSDTDAPPPHVGAYPFRRSQQALQRMMQQLKNGSVVGGGGGGAASANTFRPTDRNSVLLQHFGSTPLSQSFSLFSQAAAASFSPVAARQENTQEQQQSGGDGGAGSATQGVVSENMLPLARRIMAAAAEMNVPLQGANVVEVGCGPGGLTFTLAGLAGCGSVVGVDHSLEMIDVARQLHQQIHQQGKVQQGQEGALGSAGVDPV